MTITPKIRTKIAKLVIMCNNSFTLHQSYSKQNISNKKHIYHTTSPLVARLENDNDNNQSSYFKCLFSNFEAS